MDVIILIIAVLPGFIYKEAYQFFSGNYQHENTKDTYEVLVGLAISSLIIIFTYISLNNILTRFGVDVSVIYSLPSFVAYLEHINRLVIYLISTTILAFLYALWYQSQLEPIIRDLRNSFAKKQGKVTRKKFANVYTELFFSDELKSNPAPIVKIIKGQEEITSGFLVSWSNNASTERAFKLIHGHKINTYLTEEEYDIDYYAHFQYYDLNMDVLVKVYFGEDLKDILDV